MKKQFSNVDYKTLPFVPPFSAILALGRDEQGKEWGRLQIDHYLLRTTSESRLWMVIEDTGSLLFHRYRAIIEEVWSNPEKYDAQTENGA